jgi:flagellar protein FliS
MARRLLYANLHNDKAALDEVKNLLGEIHGAWVDIGKQGGATGAAAENPGPA